MDESARFRIAGHLIPTLREKPTKCLEKWYRKSLTDMGSTSKMITQAEKGMKQENTSEFPGIFDVWLYQHSVLSRVLWLLLWYNILTSTVEQLERRCKVFSGEAFVV